MSYDTAVAEHYTRGALLTAIEQAMATLGKTSSTVTIDDLGPVDEFHIGGRVATEHFLAQLNFSEHDHILDVGCGLGGVARFVAARFGCRVSGMDLTHEYIDTGQILSSWVGLDNRVFLRQGNVLATPFKDATFDGAMMLHVGMNIQDKNQLFHELHRVLRSGSLLGVYDIMREADGELAYPLPWAASGETSPLATAEEYRQAMLEAGFEVLQETNRRDFALEFFAAFKAKTLMPSDTPPLGINTLMGDDTELKLGNLSDNITAGFISPVELIARKP